MKPKGTQMVLEKNVPFSRSVLWKKQRDFFAQEGVNAWESQVPYYVTSNPFIAHTYAQIVAALVADWVQAGKWAAQQPFYVLELGAGPGKFSFHFLSALREAQAEYGIPDVRICYVMSDFTDANVAFWKNQSVFVEAIAQGRLDFAFFDAEIDKKIHLLHQQCALGPGQLHNPLVVVANYLFDSIPHDVFQVENNTLKEMTVELRAAGTYSKAELASLPVQAIEVAFHPKAMRQPYYPDKYVEAVLRSYADAFTRRTSFVFPLAGLQLLGNLAELSGDKLVCITSDKGYAHLQEIEGRSNPALALHGNCFSMMVNFHALGAYCQARGGDALHQSVRKGLKTSLLGIGTDFSALPLARRAYQVHVEAFGPSDFFNYHKQFRDHPEHCEWDAIVSHLRLSKWDPRIFNIFSRTIAENIGKMDEQLRLSLQAGVERVAGNIFPVQGAAESYFNLAIFYHAQGMYAQAIVWYEKSATGGQAEYGLWFNQALCYLSLEQYPQAKLAFEKAMSVRPESAAEIREWLEKIPN